MHDDLQIISKGINANNSITHKESTDNNVVEITDNDWYELYELLADLLVPLKLEKPDVTDSNLNYTAKERAAYKKYKKILEQKKNDKDIVMLSTEENRVLNCYRRKSCARRKHLRTKNGSISEKPTKSNTISYDTFACTKISEQRKRKSTSSTVSKPAPQSNKRSKYNRST